MPSRNGSVIFIRCTPADLQKIRHAAAAERRTISDFVLNAIFDRAPCEIPPRDAFSAEVAFEEVHMHRELVSLGADAEDKLSVFRLANQGHGEYAAASLARARSRIARAKEALSKLKERRKRIESQRSVDSDPSGT